MQLKNLCAIGMGAALLFSAPIFAATFTCPEVNIIKKEPVSKSDYIFVAENAAGKWESDDKTSASTQSMEFLFASATPVAPGRAGSQKSKLIDCIYRTEDESSVKLRLDSEDTYTVSSAWKHSFSEGSPEHNSVFLCLERSLEDCSFRSSYS